MKPISIAVLLIIGLFVSGADAGGKRAAPEVPPNYDALFQDGALRIVLTHSGNAEKEFFAVSETVLEPVWEGPRRNLLDPTGLGQYRLSVLSAKSGARIYSRGFCSLFGEWKTTAEAQQGFWRSFVEPLRIPMPIDPVVLLFEVRVETGAFRELQRLPLDPSRLVLRPAPPGLDLPQILHGTPGLMASTLDVLIVPEGYPQWQTAKMHHDAQRVSTMLLKTAPFNRHAARIVVRIISAYSQEIGVDEPGKGRYVNSIADVGYDTFGSERYLTPVDLRSLFETAGAAPHDAVVVMVNSGRYGGGGIYGVFSAFPVDSAQAEYLFIHEFAHSFAGLGDEYYSLGVGNDEYDVYPPGVEPWEPNLTAQTDPAKIKWRHLIMDRTPLPTPATAEFVDVVGLFEGAGYRQQGLYRPTLKSRMFGGSSETFGPVNEEAIVMQIRYFLDEEVLL